MSSKRVILPRGVVKFRSSTHASTHVADTAVSDGDMPGPDIDPLPSIAEVPQAEAVEANEPKAAATTEPPEPTKKPLANAARLPALDLKEVQRKAYERGRKVAMNEAGAVLLGTANKLNELMAKLAQARERDQTEISEFVVRLACAMTEDLVRTHIDQETHDIRGMVQGVLDEVLPNLDMQSVGLELNPDDLARLPEKFEQDGQHLVCRSDPRLPKGDFRVSGGGAEFYAGLCDRLVTMRERLLQESRDASS